ncbi:MAG: peptidylprolyl isomerase [Acidobacteriota bacterium]
MKRFLLCLGLCLLACAAPIPSQEAAAGPESTPAPAASKDSAAPRPDDPSPGAGELPESSLWVVSEVRFPNHFSSIFYAFFSGDPIQYRLLVHNLSEEPMEMPEGFDLLSSLSITREKDEQVKVRTEGRSLKSTLPDKLGPGQIIGGFFNLTEIVPDIKKEGLYTIQWELGDWKSNPVRVRVIPRFKPEVDYEATLETEEGNIRMKLLAKEAPLHVMNFVNLARLGFYNGQIFHTSSRDRSIRAGSPTKDGLGNIGYLLPAEFSSQRHVEGTVSMYRDQRRPGTDSDGSQFFICLTELPNRDGRFTIFGQIKEGLAVAKKIGAREPSADPSLPPGTPLEPAKIHRIRIREIPRTAESEG